MSRNLFRIKCLIYFVKKTVAFAGETTASILYPKGKDDTLPQSTNRSECLCYSGQDKSSRIGHGAPNLSESVDAGIGGLEMTLCIQNSITASHGEGV